MPGLIGDGHSAASSRRELDQARLSSVYSLTASVLSKLGSYEQARLTADRARTWAEVSGSPLASAAAVRELAIVLRRQDRSEEAQRLMQAAAAGGEATGLRTDASASAYAQMLCTLAYTAARGGHRTDALAMTEEARRAGTRHVSAGWEARTSALAVDVTREQWRIFGERLAVAEEQLLLAAELEPEWVTPWRRLLTSGRGLSLGKDVNQARFDAALRRDPLDPEVHIDWLSQLQPRWGGEPGQALAFARGAFARAPQGHRLGCVIAMAHIEE